ncbi:uncharacterized [Tachysurus ichikawai]
MRGCSEAAWRPSAELRGRSRASGSKHSQPKDRAFEVTGPDTELEERVSMQSLESCCFSVSNTYSISFSCVSSVTLQRGANEQTPRLCPINNGGEKDASQDPPASKQPGSRPDFHKTLPLIQSGLQLKLDHSDDKAVCGIK